MYFVQIVNDGTPGALYEAGDDYEQAQELLLKVLASGRGNVEGPVEIDDDVREFVESEGYYGNVFIVSSEAWSDVPDAYEAEPGPFQAFVDEDEKFSVWDGALYHEDHNTESLGEFQDDRFVPSKYLMEQSPAFQKEADQWATNFIGEREDAEEEDRRDHKRGLYGDE